jgi:hypothetical protein
MAVLRWNRNHDLFSIVPEPHIPLSTFLSSAASYLVHHNSKGQVALTLPTFQGKLTTRSFLPLCHPQVPTVATVASLSFLCRFALTSVKIPDESTVALKLCFLNLPEIKIAADHRCVLLKDA